MEEIKEIFDIVFPVGSIMYSIEKPNIGEWKCLSDQDIVSSDKIMISYAWQREK